MRKGYYSEYAVHFEPLVYLHLHVFLMLIVYEKNAGNLYREHLTNPNIQEEFFVTFSTNIFFFLCLGFIMQ